MTDQLSSWNDGAAKSAILDFVTKVTTPNSPTFVPPAERIATFDNDGTLWLEKPLYIQLQHGLRAIGKAAAEKPELRDRQPFKAVYEKDMAWLGKAAADYAKGDPSGVLRWSRAWPKYWKESPSKRSRRTCWTSCPMRRMHISKSRTSS